MGEVEIGCIIGCGMRGIVEIGVGERVRERAKISDSEDKKEREG